MFHGRLLVTTVSTETDERSRCPKVVVWNRVGQGNVLGGGLRSPTWRLERYFFVGQEYAGTGQPYSQGQ